MPNNASEILKRADAGSHYIEKDGVGVIVSDMLMREEGISHGFTTRRGGVSAPPFDSLNLGTSRDEPMENILQNYRLLAAAYGLDYNELALVRHEHGDKILRLDRTHAGRGIWREPLDYSDGLVTNDPNVTLMTCHADCSGFFVYDSKTRCIGLAHAGWKGMFKRIGQKLVERLSTEYGADPADMKVAVAPCICEKCFEVETELARSFAEEFDCPDIFTSGAPEKPDKGYVSLHAAALIQLFDAGVKAENISLMRYCTLEEDDIFYSYRRCGKATGSMAAFLRLV